MESKSQAPFALVSTVPKGSNVTSFRLLRYALGLLKPQVLSSFSGFVIACQTEAERM